MNSNLTAYWAIAALSFWVINHLLSARNRKYPPGPRGWPIIGNFLDLQGDHWLTFTKWRMNYGPLTYLSVLGKPIVVLNSHKAVADLLDRRAGLYSDRPPFILASEIATRNLIVLLIGHTDLWRRLRRAAHKAIGKSITPSYYPIQAREALILTQGLFTEPESWNKQLKQTTASVFSSIIYGTPPLESSDDPKIERIRDFAHRILQMLTPGRYLVEFLPWMKHLPSRMAKWKREAEEYYPRAAAEFGKMYDDVKERTDKGDENPSFTANLIKDQDKHNLTKTEALFLGATMYAAGEDTSAATLAWFIHCMVLYPEVQKKAHEQLDSVIGQHRVPTFEDYNDLPYVLAIVREVLRYRPASPIGTPHYILKDDIYDGHLIPGKAIIIANIWGLNRDPDVYGPDADEFKPERHLDESGRLAIIAPEIPEGHVTFGFGRRICLGRHVALASFFIDVVTILWAVEISPAKDVEGKPVLPSTDECDNNGIIVSPLPFDCAIAPRFPEAETILNEAQERYQS